MTNVETARRDITTAGCRPVGVWWGWERGERSVENVCICLQCPCMFSTKGLLGPCFVWVAWSVQDEGIYLGLLICPLALLAHP